MVYKMIFEQDRPYMLHGVMEALIDIADWYASPLGIFIWVYNVEKAPHVFPKFSMDKIFMEEMSYPISTGLSAKLHKKRKAPWLALLLQIRLYEIRNLKHAEAKIEEFKYSPST